MFNINQTCLIKNYNLLIKHLMGLKTNLEPQYSICNEFYWKYDNKPSFNKTKPSQIERLKTNSPSQLLHTRKFHTTPSISNIQSYDYIIVGAGSAGCVLANRLSENNNKTVNLLEAGPDDNDKSISIPGDSFINMFSPKFNWCLKSKPQKQLNDRILYFPRGKVLGGSSSINGMVYMRGHPFDYDRWENEGASGWSYSSCLPYFKKSQSHELGENLYRGGNGPLYVSTIKYDSQFHKPWIKAGIEAGYGSTDDVNGYKQEGFGTFDSTIKNGVRWSTSKAYLTPAMKNKNLTVTTQTLVTKILFNGKKAIGVELLNKDGKIDKMMVNKEVILSGGSYNSPQLLMLSGIGDGDELKKYSIDIIEHIPAVGKNMQDHMAVSIQYTCKKPITLYSNLSSLTRLKNRLQYLFFKSGSNISSHLDLGSFIRSNANVPHPDIQFHLFPYLVLEQGVDQPCHAYQISASPLRPQSRGSLYLQSNDPRKSLIIDANFCSTENDFWNLRQCIKLGREIMTQSSFNEIRGDEILPGKDIQSDDEMNSFIRNDCAHIFHPTSTCRMGSTSNNEVVVDSQCKVVGIDNLRVVNASVMPSIVSGNTNAPTIMIAERVADMILGNEILEKINNVPVWIPKHPLKQRESD